MSSRTSSSMTSTNSSSGLQDWRCPFDGEVACTTDHHPDTLVVSGFLATAAEEASHLPALRDGFQAYISSLDVQKAFSQNFRDDERVSVAKAVEQLHHLSSVYQDLSIEASKLGSGAVPDHLRAELHLASVWVKKHRASLVSCHVFYKINHTLVETSDGILEINNEDEQEIVEVCNTPCDDDPSQSLLFVC